MKKKQLTLRPVKRPPSARRADSVLPYQPSIHFGTDGWRGVIARDFTGENVTLVARAIARYLVEYEDVRRGVFVAFDTRFGADRFARRISEVLTSVGAPVSLADAPTPTPALSYAVRSHQAAAGVMLTASHNPPEWLGVKLKAGFGGSASPRAVAELERNLSEPRRLPRVAPVPSLLRTVDLKPAYLHRLAELVDLKMIASARMANSSLRFALDPMYGAGAGYLKDLLDRHGIDNLEIRFRRDPLFGGGQPEPLEEHLQPLREAVTGGECTAGFATDGDADRLAAIDATGRYVTPHEIFALLLKHLVERRRLRGAIARTFSVSDLVDRVALRYGLPVHVVPIGFKHIAERMLEEDLLMGGEESGGIGVRFHLPERDGLLNSLLLAEVVATERKPLSDCVAELQQEFGPLHYCRLDLHLAEEQKQRALPYFSNRELQQLGPWKVSGREDLDGNKLHLAEAGWVLIRASGTEPVVRVYADAVSSSLAKEIAAYVGNLIRNL